ncbi:hypothetical protein EJ06DRAFT_516018 [Trichodelitschia bisporula]|uniref:Protein BCP1 n=1 Tax=Trichodelitschia bisporula TaxID=703511 RepID=A0A6G1HL06_9PEZI|nr:hypothetical protein EJ06DRAFT_516018 [Trichodelitschia bisporula]
MDMVDVDFEWFDPQPEVDFHGLKTLCRQLFDSDAEILDLSALSDLILSQPTLGSTVKVDGNETDPYAFLTVLNLHEHRGTPVIQTLTQYIASKAAAIPALSQLPSLLDTSSPAQVGLILTERLINMPSEIIPPMYTMLLEEIEWALNDGEPYAFTHYLVLSKTYKEVESKLDAEDSRPSKKKRKDASPETFYFHPEDEILHKFAVGFSDYPYTHQRDEGSADSKRVFSDAGIEPQGHLILIEAGRFKEAVEALKDYLRQSS